MRAAEHQQRKPECTEEGLKEQIEPFAALHAPHACDAQQGPEYGERNHEPQQREQGNGQKHNDRLPMPTLLPTSSMAATRKKEWRFKLESGHADQLAF